MVTQALATRRQAGGGSITLMATYFCQQDDPAELPHNRHLYRKLLESLDIRPYAETNCRDVDVVMLTGESGALIYLLNHGTRAKTVEVSFRDIENGELVDLRGEEPIGMVGRSFTADVDAKRARLFKLLG